MKLWKKEPTDANVEGKAGEREQEEKLIASEGSLSALLDVFRDNLQTLLKHDSC